LTDRLLTAQSVEESAEQLVLDMPDVVTRFDDQWHSDAERERVSRTRFAQHTIKVDEVNRELVATHDALGDSATLERFVADSVTALDGLAVAEPARGAAPSGLRLDLNETPLSLRDRLPLAADDLSLVAAFSPPADESQVLLGRTHPLVAALAGFVVDTSLDPLLDSVASRAGLIRTDAVAARTHVLITRFRYQLLTYRQNRPLNPMLAEEAAVLAFTGDPNAPQWIDDTTTVAGLLHAPVTGNVDRETARDFLGEALAALPTWQTALAERATLGAEQLAASHSRVRQDARMTGRVEVTPSLPVDVLGVYVLLPAPSRGGAT
ncbi:MAG: hypothetical protein WBF71_13525, partial [Microthrixaceae bacterium]